MEDDDHLPRLVLWGLLAREYVVDLNKQQLDTLIEIVLKQTSIEDAPIKEQVIVFKQILDQWLKEEPIEKLIEELEESMKAYHDFCKN